MGVVDRNRSRMDLRRIGRAAVLGTGRPGIPDALEHIVKLHRVRHPRLDNADIDLLRQAYQLAEAAHRGQTRKSGEPYITHPLAVTMILAELGAETTTLVAALLHDTVEDTDVTSDQLVKEFGPEVAYLVNGVTKLEKVDYGAAAEPETFRKMLVATGNDVRVMAIKLADRLHNMRTIRHMKPASQVRIAKITRDFLIPLAERLGVQAIKAELEDLVFAVLHPADHTCIRELIATHESRPDPLAGLAQRVHSVLREARINAEVSVRARHSLSVHRVRLRAEVGAFDFGRLLVVVDEVADCYAVLGELHTCFTPVISEFQDFIAAPKFNLYQSLHTAITVPDGDIAQVLVRTRRMHQVAEAGVIALADPHGPDGEPAGPGADGERADPTRPGWLTRLLDWQSVTPDTDVFWSALRAELSEDREVTVFTSGGRTLALADGASCVDAAYAVSEDTGHRCIGARVNGRLAALSTVLRDGDTVQLFTAEDAGSGPSARWLDFAHTPLARIAVQRWLDAHPPAPEQPAPVLAAGRPGRPGTVPTADAPGLPAAPAAGGGIGPPGLGGPAVVGQNGSGPAAAPVAVAGHPHAPVRLARCCTPVPPDAVTGFLTRRGTVAVHRDECAAARRMSESGRSPVAVQWQPAAQDATGSGSGYRVTVHAEALCRRRLLADVTEAIAGAGAGIVSAHVEPPKELRVRHTYTVELPDAGSLPSLMRAMRKVAGVYDVYRARRPVG